MRVLITGGAGFIGSHLADFLLKQGHSVVVIDDLSTGSLENVRHLVGRRDFSFHEETIFQEELLSALIRDCDVVYHLAAAVGVRRIVDLPLESIKTNVAGTEVVLRLAARCLRRIVLASTSEVYGKSEQLPFREDSDLILGPSNHPRWSYACSKALDEFLALAWHSQAGLPVTIVRLFNTVGPRQTGLYGMVLPNLVRQALAGEPITVYGSGEQTRCFTHVADVVEALATIPNHDSTVGSVYNLGATTEISMNELAKLVRETTGSESPIVHIPYEQAYGQGYEDMLRRQPDISKAHAAFGFLPRRSLQEALADLIAYLQNGGKQTLMALSAR
jgi:UDP-glucose 4-epimerase